MNKILHIVTLSYPYSAGREDSFIKNELDYLAKKFERIVLYPTLTEGEIAGLPENCEINNDYAVLLKNLNDKKLINKIIVGFLSIFFWQEFLKNINKYISLKRIKGLLILSGNLKKTVNWFNKLNYENDIFYTFWFTNNTNALAFSDLSKRNKIITRVHGIDLYSERNFKNDIFRQDVLNKLSLVATISNFGKDYLINKYPVNKNIVQTFYLGIKNDNGINKVSFNRSYLNILSCSSIIKIKRVEKIYKSLILFSEKENVLVNWTHIGDGNLFNSLKKLCVDTHLLKVNMLGSMPNEHVHSFYQNNEIDLFLHLSETEGLPVVMMESLSYGVPILATNVGGISEIVLNGKTGFLLGSDPTELEVVDKLKHFYGLTMLKKRELRENCRKHWMKNFNAEINSRKFYKKLLEL